MRGVAGREKLYVEVVYHVSAEGAVTPLTIVWETGVRYRIDKVLDCRAAKSLRTRASGLRYTVCVGGQATYLWYEGPRWFVEAKVPIIPS